MFTGIVEDVGLVAGVEGSATGSRLRLQAGIARDLRAGDSLAVNGVCLTAVTVDGDGFGADIGPETARVTTLGRLRTGDRVNLERPLRANGRLDGHFVLGHVDGVGTVTAIRPEGESYWVTVGFPEALSPLFVMKGSVSIDGVSLTIAGLSGTELDVQIIPYTWAHTTLGSWRTGDEVNLECDVIGKYVLRARALGRP